MRAIAQMKRAAETSTPVEVSPEEVALHELRSAVESFNAQMLERESLTDDDEDTLDHIADLQIAYDTTHSQATRSAAEWITIRVGSDDARGHSSIVQDLNAFIRMNRATKTERFDDMVITTPSIASPDARRVLAGLAKQILTGIDAQLERIRNRAADVAAAQRKLRDDLHVWLADPTLGIFLRASLAVDGDPRFVPLSFARIDLYDLLRKFQQRALQCNSSLPLPLSVTRSNTVVWMRLAREILATQGEEK